MLRRGSLFLKYTKGAPDINRARLARMQTSGISSTHHGLSGTLFMRILLSSKFSSARTMQTVSCTAGADRTFQASDRHPQPSPRGARVVVPQQTSSGSSALHPTLMMCFLELLHAHTHLVPISFRFLPLISTLSPRNKFSSSQQGTSIRGGFSGFSCRLLPKTV